MLVVAGWRSLGLRSHMDRPGQRRGSINYAVKEVRKGQHDTSPRAPDGASDARLAFQRDGADR